MTSVAVERVVTRLSGVRAMAGGFAAKCPAHSDDNPSLRISEGEDGRALLYCHAGCPTDAILDKAGLQVSDLFEDDARGDRRIIAEYDYRDATGALAYQVVRFLPKDFRQRRPDGAGGWLWNMQGVTPLPYRLPELLAADPAAPVLIPEGEKDVDRLRAAGFVATCNHGGAGKWKPELSAHLRGRRVVILPDNDEPGRDHARKVAALLKGFAREIRIIDLPGVPEKGDVSDFLMTHGLEKFRELIASAKAATVTTEPTFREIVTVDELTEKLEKLYETGYDRGVSTGLSTLDDYYRVRPGEMTLVGGIPGHGKTGILGQFAVNLARLYKWKFAVLSAENLPLERFIADLAEKVTHKPFSEGPSPRMTRDDLRIATEFLQRHVRLLQPRQDATTVTHILELAQQLVDVDHINAVVLDPWNELSHARPERLTETEYISESLTKIRHFARSNNVHFFLVVHPRQLQKPKDDTSGRYNPPTPYEIAGSAHWFNKMDNILAVWRDVKGERATVQIHVQKIRFREVGRVGVCEVNYDKVCGRYFS